MKKKKTLLCVNISGRKVALAKIIEEDHQVVIAFLARKNDHVTLHKQKESRYLLVTYYSKDIPPTRRGTTKVEIARHIGFRDPEKHSQYVVNQEIKRESLFDDYLSMENSSGLERRLAPFICIGVFSSDCVFPIPKKYTNDSMVFLSAERDNFPLSFYYTKDRSEFDSIPLIPIETSLGYISFSTDKEAVQGKIKEG